MASILLIDDDDDLIHFLTAELESREHAVTGLERASQGLDILARTPFDLVLLDNKMPEMTGIEFLESLRKRGVRIPAVILMTGYTDSDTAIRALTLGAFEYVVKPGDFQSLLQKLEPLIELALAIKPPKEVHVPGQSPPTSTDGAKLIGDCKKMQEVYRLIAQFADSSDPVLILGETGTGKELVAKAFHNYSSRKDNPFVALNCTAITETLLESELFGHEKGAFTGADKVRKGMIEHANGGTLFLDEIGDMPLNLQAKLLRVLQDRHIRRVGGHEPIKVDFRLLSATHRDLKAALQKQEFRQDLYYRLNGVEVSLPPLRERTEDLRQLVEYFLSQFAEEKGRPRPELTPEALDRFRAHRWPGNIRELQKAVSRAFHVCRGSQLLPNHLDFPAEGTDDGAPIAESEALAGLRKAIAWAFDTNQTKLWPLLRDLLERELLKVALERLGGNQTQVAERLDISRNTVIKRMQEYDLK